jgi:hypothetical protein
LGAGAVTGALLERPLRLPEDAALNAALNANQALAARLPPAPTATT